MDSNEFYGEWLQNIPLIKNPRGNNGGKAKKRYKDIITAFDIETTNIAEIEQSVMYIWQWHFSGIGTVFGRTWQEFIDFSRKLVKNLNENEILCIYVHNLSFEFQFLKGIYQFKNEEIFATDKRKIIKCEMLGHLEFRCSYALTNMSLSYFLNKMKVQHSKLSGDDFDYSKYRLAWTELTEKELEYCNNDVEGLCEALTLFIRASGDTIRTVPITSTGYVRRDTKKAMNNKRTHVIAQSILPDYAHYKLARAAFRGGNTHANRYFVNKILKNVRSVDRVSSYPDVICNNEYPIRDFKFTPQRLLKIEVLEDYINKHKPILARLCLHHIRLRDDNWGCPYLSMSQGVVSKTHLADNGRILSADEVVITVTDIDYRIIKKEYVWDGAEVEILAYSGYGCLPVGWIQSVLKFYRAKTLLKGDETDYINYMLSKMKLNAEYGMSAQDPVRQELIYNEDSRILQETSYEQGDLYFEANKKVFLSYAWGVWVTAYARYELEMMIDNVVTQGGYFIYTDTDSVKYIGDVKWDKYNKKCIDADKISGAYATNKKGAVLYMGVAEDEGVYQEFKTLGAKKYGYIKDNKLYITIAGVNKTKGAEELSAAGGLRAMSSGFVFKKGGGTEAHYNDTDYGYYTIDGHKMYITSNVYICNSEYTLGLTQEYMTLLKNLTKGFKI